MKQLCLLGATGSIGRSILDLLIRHASEFALHSVAAQRDDVTLAQICEQFRPETAVLADPAAAQRLRERLAALGVSTRVEDGPAAIEALASDPKVDIVVAAIVGAAGLAPTLAAAHAGKRILLANKEALVCAGAVLMQAVQSGGAQLLPIDSEHNAIFQSLDSHERPPRGVRRLWLTASGGPFRGWNQAQLADVTVEMACAHPNWSMGPKISVDSATLMNKGLEVIEAHFLFGVPTADIRVLLHPQSAVHSLVEYVDGSFLAQLGCADMRIPIAHALAWPQRIESGAPCLDLAALGRLDFSEPDGTAFPCLGLAYTALECGGTAPAILNAANEVAVAAFLNGSMGFLDIAITVNDTLNSVPLSSAQTLAAVLSADAEARAVARDRIDARKRS